MSAQTPAAKMPPLWVIKLRAPFFTADLAPVLLGTALAWARTGAFNFWYFLLTLLGAVCLNAGTNMVNDYFDHVWGSDEVNTEFANPFTGGSRLIQMGLVKPKEMLWQGIGFFIAGSLIGLFLAYTRSWAVLWLGIIGVFCGYFYTAPPFRLARLGVGELAVGLCFGPLMVLGAYVVQTQALAWEPVVASIPVGLLIALVLWINQFQDAPADAQVGKNHLVVRLGRKRAATAYGVFLLLTYLSIVVGVLFAGVTPFALLGLLTVPLAWKAYQVARVHYDHPKELVPANALTIRTHLLTGLLLALAYLIQGVVGLLF
ncbi:MAG TPA: 1,4-dihydroxy-2-naphthoate octaprenyltransferase [Thermoflexia bacterium]|nr:1,4-dihydroxy-2-naphthoate octaprenyltransferase [Thermoflexia bacterium]